MQKVLQIGQTDEYAAYMDPKVVEYLRQGQTAAFESLGGFELLAFDWYMLGREEEDAPRLLIYLDDEDLFFLCPDEACRTRAQALLTEGRSNEDALYLFFTGLLRNDMAYLEQMESEITDAEDEVLARPRRDYFGDIVAWRRRLLALKHYYEQLLSVMENLDENDDGFLSENGVRRVAILYNRTRRLCTEVQSLREYVTQMREASQAQLDLEQNELMKYFTVLAAVFLPLTLLVGWYGMNFAGMPELHWRYGYPAVIALSVVICALLIWWFKRKKWF